MSQQNYIVVGAITGVYGIKGWVRIKSWTRPEANLFDYQPWLLSKAKGRTTRQLDAQADTKQSGVELDSVKLEEYRSNGGRMMVKLSAAESRDQAEQLVGRQILVAQQSLPEAGKNEYYWTDLIGLSVRNNRGVVLGKVKEMLETGANDVLVVAGDRERLVPFTQGQVVLEVNRDQGLILVDWDEDF